MLRIYLDHCVYNRPFDDKSQLTIRLEIAAKLRIQEQIRAGIFELVWSFMNDYENSENPFNDRQEIIQVWRNEAALVCVPDDGILKQSLEFRQKGLKPKDSLHLACAVHSHCDCFITTDIFLLKKQAFITEITIINPIDFVRKEEAPYDLD